MDYCCSYWPGFVLCRLCIIWSMKSSLILGYGSTGQDIEQYLISQNKNYLIHDDKENIDKKYKFNRENINNIETIFVSPGVKKDHIQEGKKS